MATEGGNVSALACEVETTVGKEIWVLVNTRLQKWIMALEGWEELELDEEMLGNVRSAVRDAFPLASPDNSKLDLELLDLILARYVEPTEWSCSHLPSCLSIDLEHL